MQHNLVRLRSDRGLSFLNAIPSLQPKSSISKAEAEMLVFNISKFSQSVFKNVVLLIDSNGFWALGFSKIQDCLRKKCPEISNSYISRLVSASGTFLSLGISISQLDRVSEATFRPLQNIETSDAKRVFEYAANLCDKKGIKRISSRDIQRAIEALNIKIEKCPSFIIDSSMRKTVLKEARIVADLMPQVNSKAEWKQLCKLFHKTLVDHCPISE